MTTYNSQRRNRMERKAVLITTDKRGVFMGYATQDSIDNSMKDGVIECNDIRMCVYWSSDVKGVIGLAAVGPSESCKITKASPSGKLNGITAVLEITEQARENWESEPWG